LHHECRPRRRAAGLRAVVGDSAGFDTRLVIEQDDPLIRSDRLALYRYAYESGQAATLAYVHDRASSEPLLAIPDAIAWAWPQGGEWRRRAGPLVIAARQV
jgi:hypothetical protein